MLAVGGSVISVAGTLVNNLYLDHTTAMLFWMISNPILFVWAIGNIKNWWNDGISIEALAAMYSIFTVTNFYGLYIGVA